MKEIKLEQIQEACEGALDKISKNTEIMLEAPLIFLLLTHPTEGPSVLHAIFYCLWDEGFEIDDHVCDEDTCYAKLDKNLE